MTASARRAAPMPADERRAAIIAATLPLVREHGRDVSTRQIAAAAGIAEGTIFRVFRDKESVLREVVVSAFDQGVLLRDLAGVDRDLPLQERMLAVVEIMQRRLVDVWGLLSALGLHRPPQDDETARDPDHRRWPPPRPSSALFVAAVAELLEPDRDQLRVVPLEAARRLRLLTFAGTHPLITDHQPLTATEIVSTLLDGVRAARGEH